MTQTMTRFQTACQDTPGTYTNSDGPKGGTNALGSGSDSVLTGSHSASENNVSEHCNNSPTNTYTTRSGRVIKPRRIFDPSYVK